MSNTHVIDPFRSAIIVMRRIEWTDIVGFAVVVPRRNLNELRSKSEQLIPPVVPEQVRGENPILTIRDFRPVMSEEPG